LAYHIAHHKSLGEPSAKPSKIIDFWRAGNNLPSTADTPTRWALLA
jgi:hypothetical protein